VENIFFLKCHHRNFSFFLSLSGFCVSFFTVRVVKHWSRLSREVVDAPPLESFKVRLHGALSNLIELKMALLTAEGLD